MEPPCVLSFREQIGLRVVDNGEMSLRNVSGGALLANRTGWDIQDLVYTKKIYILLSLLHIAALT